MKKYEMILSLRLYLLIEILKNDTTPTKELDWGWLIRYGKLLFSDQSTKVQKSPTFTIQDNTTILVLVFLLQLSLHKY